MILAMKTRKTRSRLAEVTTIINGQMCRSFGSDQNSLLASRLATTFPIAFLSRKKTVQMRKGKTVPTNVKNAQIALEGCRLVTPER